MTLEEFKSQRDNRSIKEKFLDLACDLSPENLTCDGELPRSKVLQRLERLRREWAGLEKEIGRKVSEDEVWGWAK